VSRGGGASLIRTAAHRLVTGPVHTLDLALPLWRYRPRRRRLGGGLSTPRGGPPLRGRRRGVWIRDAALAQFGAPLSDVPFAVVDAETTGGASWPGHTLIEITIVKVRGARSVDEYETLVNPGQGIPSGIVALTGITTEMVAGAPYFYHIADGIERRLAGRAFVVHNATFDWGFVSAEMLSAVGDAPHVPTLCTVRMARRRVPQLRRRNLDVLACHRAYGDTVATTRILLRMLDEAAGRGIEDFAPLQWYLERRRQRKQFDPEQYPLDLPGSESRKRTGRRR